MNGDERLELVMLLRGFHDLHTEGSRVARHLLAWDLHEVMAWCDAHPETVSRRV